MKSNHSNVNTAASHKQSHYHLSVNADTFASSTSARQHSPKEQPQNLKSKVLQQLLLQRQQQSHLYQQLCAIRPTLNHDLELLFSIGCSRGESTVSAMQMSRASFSYFLEQFGATTLTPYHEFERKATIHLRDRELRLLEVEAVLASEDGYEDPYDVIVETARGLSTTMDTARATLKSPPQLSSSSISPRMMSPMGMSNGGIGSLQTTARGKSRERDNSTAMLTSRSNSPKNTSKKPSRGDLMSTMGTKSSNNNQQVLNSHRENTHTLQLLRIAEDSVDALFDYGLGFATKYQHVYEIAPIFNGDEGKQQTNEAEEPDINKVSPTSATAPAKAKKLSLVGVGTGFGSPAGGRVPSPAGKEKALRVDQFVLLCLDIAKRMVPIDDYPPLSNLSLHLDLMQQLFLGPFAAEFKQMMIPGRTLNEFNISPSVRELIQGPVLDTLAHAYASVTNAAMITINGSGENTTSGATTARMGGGVSSYATAGLASAGGEDEVDDVMRADFFIQMFTGDIPLEYEAIIALLQHVGISTAQLGGDFLYKLFQRYDTKLYDSRTTIDFHGFVLLLLHVCVIRYGTDRYKLELATVASRFQRLLREHFNKQFPVDERLYYISKAEDLARVVKPMSVIHTLNVRGTPSIALDGLRPAVATRGAQLWVFGNNFPVKSVSHGKKCPLYVRFGSSPIDHSTRVLDGGLVFSRGACSSPTMGSVSMPHINPTADTRTDLIVLQTDKKHAELDEELNEDGEPKDHDGDTDVKITGGKRDDYAKQEEKFNYSVLLESTTSTPVFISVDRITWTLRDDVVIDYKDTLLKLRLPTELVRKFRQIFTSFGLRGPDYEEEGELRVGNPYVGLQQWAAICQHFPIAGIVEDGDLDTLFQRHPIFFEIAKPRSDYIDLNAPVVDFNEFIKLVFRYFNAAHGVTTRLADFISVAFDKAAPVSQAYRKEYYKKKFAFWTPSQGRDFTEKIINSDATIDNSRSDAFLTNVQTGSVAGVAEGILNPTGDDAVDKVSCVNCGCNPQIKDGNAVLEIEWNASSLSGDKANAPAPKGYEHAFLATKDFSASDHKLPGGKPPHSNVPRTASSLKTTGRIKGGGNNNASFRANRGTSRERNNETIASGGGGDLLQSSMTSSRGGGGAGKDNNQQGNLITNESFFGELAREHSFEGSHTDIQQQQQQQGMSPRVKAAVGNAIKVLQKKRKLKPVASTADQLPIEDGQLQSYIFKTLATMMETMPTDDISDEIDADTYAGMTYEKGMALPPRGQMCFISALLDRFLTLHNEVVAEGEAYFQKSTAKARAAGRFLSLQLFTLQRSMEAISGCIERLEGLVNDTQHTAQEERKARLAGEIRNSDTWWAMEGHLLAGIKRSMTFIGDLTRPYINEDVAIEMSMKETISHTDNFLKEIQAKALELDNALRSRVVAAKEGPASEKIAGMKVGNELRAAIAEAGDINAASYGDIGGAEASTTGGANNSNNSFSAVVNKMSNVTQVFATGRHKVDPRALELQKRELTDDFERKIDDLKLSLSAAFEEQKSEYETKAFLKTRETTNLLHTLLKHAQEEINIPKDISNPCFRVLNENGISLRRVTHGASGRKEEDIGYLGNKGDNDDPIDVGTQACEEELPAVQEMQQWLTLRGIKNAQRLAVCGTVLRQSFLIGKRSLTKYATNPTMFDDFSKMLKSELQFTMNSRHTERISLPKQSEMATSDAITGTLLTMKEFTDAEKYAGFELQLQALEKLVEITEEQSRMRNNTVVAVKTAVANQKTATAFAIMDKLGSGMANKGGPAATAKGKGGANNAATAAAKQKEKEEAAAHKQLMNQAATHYVSAQGVLLPIPPSLLVANTSSALPNPQNFVLPSPGTVPLLSSPTSALSSPLVSALPTTNGGLGVETQFDRDVQFAILQQRMVRRAARMDANLIENMHSFGNRCKFIQTTVTVAGPMKEGGAQTDIKDPTVPIPTQTELAGSDYEKLQEQLRIQSERVLSAASSSRSDEQQNGGENQNDSSSFFITNSNGAGNGEEYTGPDGTNPKFGTNKFAVLPGFIAGGPKKSNSDKDPQSASQSLSAKGTKGPLDSQLQGGGASSKATSQQVSKSSNRRVETSMPTTTPHPVVSETDKRATLEDDRRARAGLPPRGPSAGTTPQVAQLLGNEAKIRSVRSTPQSSSLRQGINSGGGDGTGLLAPSDVPSTASSFAQRQAELKKKTTTKSESRKLEKSKTVAYDDGKEPPSSVSSVSSGTTSESDSLIVQRPVKEERRRRERRNERRLREPGTKGNVSSRSSYSSMDSDTEDSSYDSSRFANGTSHDNLPSNDETADQSNKHKTKDHRQRREGKSKPHRSNKHIVKKDSSSVPGARDPSQASSDEGEQSSFDSKASTTTTSTSSSYSVMDDATEEAERHKEVSDIYDGTSSRKAKNLFEKVDKREKSRSKADKKIKSKGIDKKHRQAKVDKGVPRDVSNGEMPAGSEDQWQSLPLGLVENGSDNSFDSETEYTESISTSSTGTNDIDISEGVDATAVCRQADKGEKAKTKDNKKSNSSRRRGSKVKRRSHKPHADRHTLDDDQEIAIGVGESQSNSLSETYSSYSDEDSVGDALSTAPEKLTKIVKRVVPVKKLMITKRPKAKDPTALNLGSAEEVEEVEEITEEIEELEEVEMEVTDTEAEAARPVETKSKSQKKHRSSRSHRNNSEKSSHKMPTSTKTKLSVKSLDFEGGIEDEFGSDSQPHSLKTSSRLDQSERKSQHSHRKNHHSHSQRSHKHDESPSRSIRRNKAEYPLDDEEAHTNKSLSSRSHHSESRQKDLRKFEEIEQRNEESRQRRHQERDERRALRRSQRHSSRHDGEEEYTEETANTDQHKPSATPTSKSGKRLTLALTSAQDIDEGATSTERSRHHHHQRSQRHQRDDSEEGHQVKYSPKPKSRNLGASLSDLSSSLKPITVVDIPSTYKYFNEMVLDEREEVEDIVLPSARGDQSPSALNATPAPYVTVSVKCQTVTRRFAVISTANPLPAYTATKTLPVTYIAPSLPESVKHYLIECQKKIQPFELESIRNAVAYNEWLAKNNVRVHLDKELANAKLSQDELKNAVMEARRGSKARSVEVSHRQVVNHDTNSVAIYKGYGGNTNINGGAIEVRSFGRSLADSVDSKAHERTPMVKVLTEESVGDMNTSLDGIGNTSPKSNSYNNPLMTGRRKSSNNSIKSGYRIGLLKKTGSTLTPDELAALSRDRADGGGDSTTFISPSDLVIKHQKKHIEDDEDGVYLDRSEYEDLKDRCSDASVVLAERDLVRNHLEALLKRFGTAAMYQKFKLDTNGAGLYEIAEFLETELRKVKHERSVEALNKAETLRKEGHNSAPNTSKKAKDPKISPRKHHSSTGSKKKSTPSPIEGVDLKSFEALKDDCAMVWLRHFGPRTQNESLSQRQQTLIMTDYASCARALALHLLGDSLKMKPEVQGDTVITSPREMPPAEGGVKRKETPATPQPQITIPTNIADRSLAVIEDLLSRVRKGQLTEERLKNIAFVVKNKDMKGGVKITEPGTTATTIARDEADEKVDSTAVPPTSRFAASVAGLQPLMSPAQQIAEVNYLINSMFALLDDRLGDPPTKVAQSQTTLNVWRQQIISTLLTRIRQTAEVTDSRFGIENASSREVLEIAERWSGVHDEQKSAIDQLVTFPILNNDQQRLVSFFHLRACGFILHSLATDERRFLAIARSLNASPEDLHSEAEAKKFVISTLFCSSISSKMVSICDDETQQSWAVLPIRGHDIPSDWAWRLASFNANEYVELDSWARDNGHYIDEKMYVSTGDIDHDNETGDSRQVLQRYRLLRDTYLKAAANVFGPLGTLSPLQWLSRAKACVKIWTKEAFMGSTNCRTIGSTENVGGSKTSDLQATPRQQHNSLPSINGGRSTQVQHHFSPMSLGGGSSAPVQTTQPNNSSASPLGKCPVSWLQQQPLMSQPHHTNRTMNLGGVQRNSFAATATSHSSAAAPFSLMMQRRLLQLTPPPRDPPPLSTESLITATPQKKNTQATTDISSPSSPQASMLNDASKFLLQLFPKSGASSELLTHIHSLDEGEAHELDLLREKCLAPWASTNVASTVTRKWLVMELRQAASVHKQSYNSESGAQRAHPLTFSKKIVLLLQKVLGDKQPLALQRQYLLTDETSEPAASSDNNTVLVDTLLSLSRGQTRVFVQQLAMANVKGGDTMAYNPAAQSSLPSLRFK